MKKKRNYLKPEIEVCDSLVDCEMLTVSAGGGPQTPEGPEHWGSSARLRNTYYDDFEDFEDEELDY